MIYFSLNPRQLNRYNRYGILYYIVFVRFTIFFLEWWGEEGAIKYNEWKSTPADNILYLCASSLKILLCRRISYTVFGWPLPSRKRIKTVSDLEWVNNNNFVRQWTYIIIFNVSDFKSCFKQFKYLHINETLFSYREGATGEYLK